MAPNTILVTLTLACTLFGLTSSLPARNGNSEVNSPNTAPGSGEIVDPPEIEENAQQTLPNEEPVAPPDVKRSAPSGYRIQERLLSREGSPVEIRHIEFKSLKSHRRKRTVFTSTAETWPHRIPYKLESTYPSDLAIRLRNILSFIERHLCVTFTEEPDFDVNDNTYGLKSYINFKYISGTCSADSGRGGATYEGARNVRTCLYWDTIVHEVFHALGAVHEHQAPSAPMYLYNMPANIPSSIYYNFATMEASRVESDVFDPSSVLLYNQMDFSANGLPSLVPIRDDLFALNAGHRNNIRAVVLELNKVYKCHEFACNNTEVDCGRGYYTRHNGQCQCICPDGFGTSSNCANLVDSTFGPTSWPDAPVILWAADANSCPDGMSVGVIRVAMSVYIFADPSFKDGSYFAVWTCSKSSSTTNLNAMPAGSYCVVKPVGVSCEYPFKEGSYTIHGHAPVTTSGTVGDITINGNSVTVRFCCRSDRSTDHSLELPNTKNFRMLPSTTTKCQSVAGMSHRLGKTVIIASGTTKAGDPPVFGIYSYYNYVYHCMYYAPTYGCNQIITLGEGESTVTIKTPGFVAGAREQNTRCLYYFDVPKDSRLSVRFDTFDMDANDFFGLRRYNPWVKPLILSNSNYRKHYVSVADFLFMEFWSVDKSSSAKGVQFTVTLTTKEEMCYDVETRGKHYRGTKWVTETREACIPWLEARSCSDFPFKGVSLFHLKYQANKCINPGGQLEEPWCYTFVDGTSCQKRYCDVCNLMQEGDLFDNCEQLIAADPTFCTSSLQRLGCADACDILAYPPPPMSSECSEGWTALGDRCWRWFDGAQSQAEAEKSCNGYGGTIFRIRNSADVQMIMDFQRDTSDVNAKNALWTNGRFSSHHNSFLTLGDQQRLSMLDLASTAMTNDASNIDLFIREYGQSEAGRLDTASDAVSLTTICELPRRLTYGPPAAPPHSEPTEPLESEYQPGDQVTFRCNKLNHDSHEVTIECGSEGWPTLNSVCSPCPNGWNEYKDRCWIWVSSGHPQQTAQDACVTLDGTLFKIRDQEDLDMIRNFKQTYSHYASEWNTWLNAKRGADGQYYTLNDNTLVTFLPWASTTDLNDPSLSSVCLLGEDKSEPGKYATAPSTSPYRYFCEMPRQNEACEDTSTAECEGILSYLPDFCKNPDTKDSAEKLCPASCGSCADASETSSEECPAGWLSHQNRCYQWFGSAKPQTAAETYCNGLHDTGTLFKVEDANDLNVLRSFMQASSLYGSKWNTWLNAKRDTDGVWYTLDDHTPVSFFDWAGAVDPSTDTGTNLFLLGEDKSEPGKYSISADSSVFRFFCQLTLDITFTECQAPQGTGSHATSSSVGVGDAITFVCDDNLFYDMGDAQRACLSDGTLLGEELVCSDNSKTVSINENRIISRSTFLNLNTAFVFNVPSMTIPHDGKISAWYFYATHPGLVTFMVFRYDSANNTFSQVGQNDVTVSQLNYKWSVSVPEPERIQVKEGDYLGVYATAGKIAANSCYNKAVQLMVVAKKSGVSLADLAEPQTFSSQCIIPSVGASLEI